MARLEIGETGAMGLARCGTVVHGDLSPRRRFLNEPVRTMPQHQVVLATLGCGVRLLGRLTPRSTGLDSRFPPARALGRSSRRDVRDLRVMDSAHDPRLLGDRRNGVDLLARDENQTRENAVKSNGPIRPDNTRSKHFHPYSFQIS